MKTAAVVYLLLGVASVGHTLTVAGTIVALLAGTGGLLIFGYGAKWYSAWKVASTQAEELRKAAADKELRIRTFEDRERAHLASLAQMTERVASLEARPDLTGIVELLTAALEREQSRADARTQEAVDAVSARLSLMDEAAAERQQELLKHVRPAA